LFDFFVKLQDGEGPMKVGFRYVLALMLVRKHHLRLDGFTDQDGKSFMKVFCPRLNARYRVVEPDMSAQQMIKVQDQLVRLLDADAVDVADTLASLEAGDSGEETGNDAVH
jgi:hypothetical protein